jgi:diadenosine tetraphosphatase ApaH/serine/threonine PP2A family protein phosphatase
MRYLVLSDIHANLEALDAVLAAAAPLRHERLLVLGDLVGYGADPNLVVDRVRALGPHTIIRGNHDKVGSGLETPDGFNVIARSAIRWTFETLTPDNREWLAGLPAGPIAVDALLDVCHGTPYDEDAYVFDDGDALRALQTSRRPVCLFGHTHVQVGYRLAGHSLTLATMDPVRPFDVPVSDGRFLINPGSVGQPRDGDPRAAFCVADTQSKTVTIHRVDYPIARAQARIVAEGLPEVLAQRLALGR